MKHQALFVSIGKSKKNKVSSAEIFIWRFKGYIGIQLRCKIFCTLVNISYIFTYRNPNKKAILGLKK